MIVIRDVLWAELLTLARQRLDAVQDRAIEEVFALVDDRERLIRTALSDQGNETAIVWGHIEQVTVSLTTLSENSRQVDDLLQIHRELAFCVSLLAQFDGRPAVKVGLSTIASDGTKPAPTKAPQDIHLSDEVLRTIKTALSVNYTQIIRLCSVLWPDEYDEADQKIKGALINRFRNTRIRALKVIPKVLRNPELEAALPGPQREFYAWLREQFGDNPIGKVKRQLNNFGQPSTRQKVRGSEFVLARPKLRVMRALLLEEHASYLDAAKALWPKEAATGKSDALSTRLSHDKERGLLVMERVLTAPDRSALKLPANEARFYDEVIAKFGLENTFEKVSEHANRYSPKKFAEAR